jgi:hypothetical protein
MNEERTGKSLRQVERIRGHLWHRYSIAVRQVKHVNIEIRSKIKYFNWKNDIEKGIKHLVMKDLQSGEDITIKVN